MNEKFWQKLLRKWREEGRDGFSIPYIIGSQQYLPANHNSQDIHDLITDIIETGDETILLRYCFNIGDLILEITGGMGENKFHRFPSLYGSSQSILKVSNFMDDLGNTTEDLIEILTERYEPFINAGLFSINEGERGDYTPTEKIFIRTCYEDYFSS
ncbi:MAG: hypothetical protein JST86_18450 [Bacteroidetes bacterium]|nr:hypothetical protein [Bacteroidota bacterium]